MAGRDPDLNLEALQLVAQRMRIIKQFAESGNAEYLVLQEKGGDSYTYEDGEITLGQSALAEIEIDPDLGAHLPKMTLSALDELISRLMLQDADLPPSEDEA